MKTRKLFLLLTMLIVAAFVLAACGEAATEEPMAKEPAAEEPMAEEPATEEPAAEEPVVEEPVDEGPCAPADAGPLAGVDPRGQTIVWWHNHSGSREEKMLPLLAQFNETNECGITLDPQNQGGYNDIRDKVNASIAAGEQPLRWSSVTRTTRPSTS
jgi:multiple sugar transport system substrate-binding protein/sn-glycerol 3-phosphate transport system substrate-binding protein